MHKSIVVKHHRPESVFAGRTLIKEKRLEDNEEEKEAMPTSISAIEQCKCSANDGGCFNGQDWYIKMSISVDGEKTWYDMKPDTQPTNATEVLTGIIDIPKYVVDESVDGYIKYKFTQNTRQCSCCDDLFIRLVKPLRGLPSQEEARRVAEAVGAEFINYDGFYF